MNIEQKRAKTSLSDDLTVVFLRGNGSPRTFRVPIPALQRSLTAFGFVFCFALLAALFFLALNLMHTGADAPLSPPPAPVAVAPAPVPVPAPVATVTATATSAAAASTVTATATATITATATTTITETATAGKGFWSKLTGGGTAAPSDPELKKEVDGLHADVARLNAQIDNRKELPKGTGNLLQLFGPRAVLLTEENTNVRVKNARVLNEGGKDLTLVFEIHNTDPQQVQERGYIVVIAKTNDLLMVYPPNAFSPTQNIVLDFTKGETFGVSRFREARATFPAAELANRHPRFQILLFSTDGRVIANQHVEEPQ